VTEATGEDEFWEEVVPQELCAFYGDCTGSCKLPDVKLRLGAAASRPTLLTSPQEEVELLRVLARNEERRTAYSKGWRAPMRALCAGALAHLAERAECVLLRVSEHELFASTWLWEELTRVSAALAAGWGEVFTSRGRISLADGAARCARVMQNAPSLGGRPKPQGMRITTDLFEARASAQRGQPKILLLEHSEAWSETHNAFFASAWHLSGPSTAFAARSHRHFVHRPAPCVECGGLLPKETSRRPASLGGFERWPLPLASLWPPDRTRPWRAPGDGGDGGGSKPRTLDVRALLMAEVPADEQAVDELAYGSGSGSGSWQDSDSGFGDSDSGFGSGSGSGSIARWLDALAALTRTYSPPQHVPGASAAWTTAVTNTARGLAVPDLGPEMATFASRGADWVRVTTASRIEFQTAKVPAPTRVSASRRQGGERSRRDLSAAAATQQLDSRAHLASAGEPAFSTAVLGARGHGGRGDITSALAQSHRFVWQAGPSLLDYLGPTGSVGSLAALTSPLATTTTSETPPRSARLIFGHSSQGGWSLQRRDSQTSRDCAASLSSAPQWSLRTRTLQRLGTSGMSGSRHDARDGHAAPEFQKLRARLHWRLCAAAPAYAVLVLAPEALIPGLRRTTSFSSSSSSRVKDPGHARLAITLASPRTLPELVRPDSCLACDHQEPWLCVFVVAPSRREQRGLLHFLRETTAQNEMHILASEWRQVPFPADIPVVGVFS
jgi:hypothetical protein